MMRPASWSETSMRYDYYWPAIQAAANSSGGPRRSRCAGYLDVAREQGRGQGVAALMRVLKSPAVELPPFAPSFLYAGRWLRHRHQYSAVPRPALGLVPKPETSRLWAHQLQLTVEYLVIETHATRHPLAGHLYYHEQKPRRGAPSRSASRINTISVSAGKATWHKPRPACHPNLCGGTNHENDIRGKRIAKSLHDGYAASAADRCFDRRLGGHSARLR